MASIKELEALVAERWRLLEEAEAALAAARGRLPVVGDFVRSTLTNFYGRVTKVVPRPSGRPWVEITPYLAPGLPGHSTLDLYEAWEIIDDPPASEEEAAHEPSGAEIVSKLTEVIVSYDFIAPGSRRA
jgi:hypothetical protein